MLRWAKNLWSEMSVPWRKRCSKAKTELVRHCFFFSFFFSCFCVYATGNFPAFYTLVFLSSLFTSILIFLSSFLFLLFSSFCLHESKRTALRSSFLPPPSLYSFKYLFFRSSKQILLRFIIIIHIIFILCVIKL